MLQQNSAKTILGNHSLLEVFLTFSGCNLPKAVHFVLPVENCTPAGKKYNNAIGDKYELWSKTFPSDIFSKMQRLLPTKEQKELQNALSFDRKKCVDLVLRRKNGFFKKENSQR